MALAVERASVGCRHALEALGEAGVERELGWKSVLARVRGGEAEIRERIESWRTVQAQRAYIPCTHISCKHSETWRLELGS